MFKRILVTGESLVPRAVMDYLEEEGFKVAYYQKDTWTAEELSEALRGVSGYLIGGYEEPTSKHFEEARDLEVVAWPGTDYKAYVPGWQRAYELGIAFVNAPGANANSVAEFTIGLIIILLRKTGLRFQTLKDVQPFAGSGTDLLDKTLGIIGMGRIGSRVAYIAKLGFRMNIVYTSRSRHPDIESALDAEWLSKSDLFSASDVVTLHRPGLLEGEPTELGAQEFALMKKGSVLINTVKWNLVDLDALYHALTEGNLGAAAFDGAGKGESWDRLTSLGWDRFVWFPQTGFNTEDANYRASMIAARAVVDVLRGGSNPNVNNPDFRTRQRQE
jgi:phosphoglycerate dehydrogenase-like enzyme